jgi:L,D-peptidoglycan transpeptidase YkuD (ErfK/YbiS/YcfS/YnhG family)
MRFVPALFGVFALAFVVSGCASLDGGSVAESTGEVPRTPTAHAPWPDANSRQLIVVLTPGWDAAEGRLARFSRADDGQWIPVGDSFDVTVGRSGAAWGRGLHPAQSEGPQKQEGDGRAPAGVFALGIAFGYAEGARSGLPYRAMSSEDWCIDVPGSPLYNQLVNTNVVGARAIEGSTEPMRRDIHKEGDQRYRSGFVIEHNAEGADRGGSCIFAHLWKAPGVPTAGCTAMSDENMQAVLAWLDPEKTPRFVLLPVSEYARLQPTWQLPAPNKPDRHE